MFKNMRLVILFDMFLNYVIIFITLIADIRNDILIKEDKYSFFIKVGAANVSHQVISNIL